MKGRSGLVVVAVAIFGILGWWFGGVMFPTEPQPELPGIGREIERAVPEPPRSNDGRDEDSVAQVSASRDTGRAAVRRDDTRDAVVQDGAVQDGVVRGLLVDPSGRPIEGVRVTGVPRDWAEGSTRADPPTGMEDPEAGPAEDSRRPALRLERLTNSTVRTVSDASGEFRLPVRSESAYDLSFAHDFYRFRAAPSGVRAGDSIRATGTLALELEVVAVSDLGPVDVSEVAIRPPTGFGPREIPSGRLFTVVPASYDVRVTGTVAGVSVRSEWQKVVVESSNRRVEVPARPSTVVEVWVENPHGPAGSLPRTIWRPLESAADFDEGKLRRMGRRISSGWDLDPPDRLLDPPTSFVAIGVLREDELVASRVVEVQPGSNRVDFTLPPPNTGPPFQLHVTTEDGREVQQIDVELRVVGQHEWQSVRELRGANGRFEFTLEESFARWIADPVEEVRLEVKSGDLQSGGVRVTEPRAAVVLQESAELEISVTLPPGVADGSQLLFEAREIERSNNGSQTFGRMDESGVARLQRLAPGWHELWIQLSLPTSDEHRYPVRLPILRTEIDLRPGSNSVSLSLPSGSPLTVDVIGDGRLPWPRFYRLDPDVPASSYLPTNRSTPEVVIPWLPHGRYVVTFVDEDQNRVRNFEHRGPNRLRLEGGDAVGGMAFFAREDVRGEDSAVLRHGDRVPKTLAEIFSSEYSTQEQIERGSVDTFEIERDGAARSIELTGAMLRRWMRTSRGLFHPVARPMDEG